MAAEERDCTEGCDGDHLHKWEIAPHPYSNDFDTYVTDDDAEARAAMEAASEQAWDQCGDGMTMTVTIKRTRMETRCDCDAADSIKCKHWKAAAGGCPCECHPETAVGPLCECGEDAEDCRTSILNEMGKCCTKCIHPSENRGVK